MLILHIYDYLMQKENFNSSIELQDYEEYKNLFFDMIVAFVAVSLSIWCNKKEPFGARVIYSLFALFFGHLYLFWFVIYRLLFGYYTLCGTGTSTVNY